MHSVGCLRDTEILTEVYSLAEEANTNADHSKGVKRRMLGVSSVIKCLRREVVPLAGVLFTQWPD